MSVFVSNHFVTPTNNLLWQASDLHVRELRKMGAKSTRSSESYAVTN